jgi:hypothetical protein
MSILDELDLLKKTITDGLASIEAKALAGVGEVRAEAAAARDSVRDEAAKLRGEIAAGAAREWVLMTAKGKEVKVADRDAIQLFAAVPICLARKTAVIRLGGQDVEVMWTDLEQLAAQIAKEA